MNRIIAAHRRLQQNPGLTVAEAVEWAMQQPMPRRKGVVTTVVQGLTIVALAAMTVVLHHKDRRRH